MARPRTVPAYWLFRRLEDLHARIARRAGCIAGERGATEGFGVDDWFRAESEVLLEVPLRCTLAADEVRVEVGLPGVAPEDVELSLSERELVLGVRGRLVAVRAIELPAAVQPARAGVFCASGVLTVQLPRQAKRSA